MDVPEYFVTNPLFIDYYRPLRKNKVQRLYEMKLEEIRGHIRFFRDLRRQMYFANINYTRFKKSSE